MSKLKPGHPIGYMFRRETQNPSKYPSSWTPCVDQKLLSTRNFFRKNLYSHFGCVNAIEFSNDGSYLVSGGDDRRILLWNVSAALKSKAKPIRIMQAEHGSNVFALAIDSCNTKIFSAGNDDQVIVHDVTTGAPLDYFVHEQPVYGISIDPLNDNIFASACDDGRLLVYDIRESSADPFCLASLSSAFHAVQFHPTEPRLIVSGNSKEGVALWDVRKPKTPILRYGGLNADQCCMSARFNSDGSKVLALRRRLPPILYSTDNTAHLFQFNHPGYYNSCTMKSCAFAGQNDEFVLSGSDNFDLYLWRIPPGGSDRWVDKAHVILKGHRSIVNQVRYNKAHSVIMSSGVEKLIKVWSPFSMLSGSKSVGVNEAMFTMNERERRIYSHTEYINLVTQSGQFMSLTFDTTRKTTKEDPRMMAFFDALVLRDLEGWSEDSDNIAESSYAVVSQESSSDDSEEVLSQSIFNTSIETTTTEATTVNNHNDSQQGLHQQQLRESEGSESDSVIIPISSFEDGASYITSTRTGNSNVDSTANTNTSSVSTSSNNNNNHNNQRTLPRLDLYIDHSNNSTDDDDDDDDTFKNFIENLPQNTNKHSNIIKELISKKNDKLHQLAKAHVVLESTIKKPGKKRVGRNYRAHQTDTSSDKQEGKENGEPSKKKCKRKLYKKTNNLHECSSADSDSDNSENGNHDDGDPQQHKKERKLDSGQSNSSSSGSKSDCSSNNSDTNIDPSRRHRRRRLRRSSKPRASSLATTSPTCSRSLNKRKMFESFKNLRYERENSNGSNVNGESGPFCSFYCQSQGRYTHKRTSSSSDSNTENTNREGKHGIKYSKNKTEDTSKDIDKPCTSTSTSTKEQETKNKIKRKKLDSPSTSSKNNNTDDDDESSSSSTSSSSSSSTSSNSNSSSTSQSGSDSSSTYCRRTKLKFKPSSSSSPSSVSKKLVPYPSTNNDDSSSRSSSDDDENDQSELCKIQSQIDSIKNSPAFKLSPLIRRIEKERLRKLIQEKERIKDKNHIQKIPPVGNEELEELEENESSSSFLNVRKRTWCDSQSSTINKESKTHQSLPTVPSSCTSSESPKEENRDYTFLSKPSKKRLKYLNPNYKNYSSNGQAPQSPNSELLLCKNEESIHKSDNNNTTTATTTTTTGTDEETVSNNNDKTTLHSSSLVEILEHDFENQNQNNNNTDIDLNTISHNFFDQELNNNNSNDPPFITTAMTNTSVFPTEVNEENSVSSDFNINDDDQDLHFTHLS